MMRVRFVRSDKRSRGVSGSMPGFQPGGEGFESPRLLLRVMRVRVPSNGHKPLRGGWQVAQLVEPRSVDTE